VDCFYTYKHEAGCVLRVASGTIKIYSIAAAVHCQ